MMKLGMFTDAKKYAEWCNGMADRIEQNGLRMYRENLEEALRGVGKDQWLDMNNISEGNRESEWLRHIEWLRGQVKSVENKVKKYRRDAKRALA